ncbi:aspartic peptidase domain-containing protein [Mycena rosella]|uniref:Aspartic peptidase domain-containing protein n=1 Tax=Mycena rosella TaxID=1033263 RepID=A0AAD7GK77_MYCRO|nr:aspartic peptidase domain-containing protein [Mycena rosella]
MGILALISLLSLFSGATRAVHPAQHISHSAILPHAEFAIPFTAKRPRRESKKHALRGLRGIYSKLRTNTVALDGGAFDTEYLVNITIGGKNFQVIMDTGSSDTWVVHTNFTCFDLSGNSIPAAACEFGPAQFDPADSLTFQLFPNVTFFVRYGSGESLSGPAGFDTVTVGELSVSKQEIGIPNHNAFLGDGVSEGVFGLAFPELTSVWNTTTAQNASGSNHILYNPFFLNAIQQNKIQNFFSISLNRPTFNQQAHDPFDPHLGFLAFGGSVPIPITDTAVTVPIQRYAANAAHIFVPSDAANATFTWYTVDIDSYTFPGSSTVPTTNNNTILDTGTTLNWVPTAVAVAYNAQFSPPATLDSDLGVYVVDCNATAPPFSVVLGGTSFAVDPRDQIVPQANHKDVDGNTICVSGTQDEGLDVPGNIFTLGDVFLHNVVVTYNPVDDEVTVAQRPHY